MQYSAIDLTESTKRNILSLGVLSTVTFLSQNPFKMEGKIAVFKGEGNVREFLTKVELHSALKGYTGEKIAHNLDSKLEGPAFDVYTRLSTEDRKNFETIKAELLKEFERGQSNRDEAISELSKRRRKEGESAQTFAYKLAELVKLAYPKFDHNNCETIAKDYFVMGLHPDMQIALKSLEKFSRITLNELAAETTRLELAGIKSQTKDYTPQSIANNVNNVTAETPLSAHTLEVIADKVVEKLNTALNIQEPGGAAASSDTNVNFAGNFAFRPQRNFQRGSRSDRRPFRGRSAARGGSQQRKCRACQSPSHLVRDCPTRFCQACGQRGHDSWNPVCSKFQ